MQKLLQIYNGLFDFWLKFPQTIRYLLVGGYNTVVSYLIYVFFVLYYGQDFAQLALFLSFILSSFNSFFTQRTFVFLSEGDYRKEYLKCLMTWSLGYLMNAVVLHILKNWIGLNAYLAGLFAIVVATCVTYFLLKYFAFGEKNESCCVDSVL